MFKGIEKTDWDTFVKAYPEEMFEDIEDSWDLLGIDDGDEYMEFFIESLEESYGDNIKISYKILDKKELSSRKLKNLKSILENTYDIDADSLKKAYEVELKTTIKGKDDKETNEKTITVGKLDGKWAILSGIFDY